MRSAFRSLACVSAVVVVAALAACSSATTTTVRGTPACDSTKCAPGNECLELDGEVKCRKTCASNSDPAASCPFGYTCTDTLTGQPPFCIRDEAVNSDGEPLEKRSGQWGAACQANLGVVNSGCDAAQGFYCYGISPTDGEAYCTRYYCESDKECGAGFWCARTNVTPNADTAKRTTYGEAHKVCLRRTYCATCTSDVDCPTVAGKKQRCIPDDSGSSFCAPECDDNSNCPNEAYCADAGLEAKICFPRARVCVGDGALCSPCRSDVDCGEDGLCVKGQYTTEKFCAKKAPNGDCTACPKPELGAGHEIGCGEVKKVNYCYGMYAFGKKVPTNDGPQQPYDLGCYTPKR